MPDELRQYTAFGRITCSDVGLDPQVLQRYLEGGGSIVSLVGGDHRRIAEQLGSQPALDLPEDLTELGEGVRIDSDFALGEGLALSDKEVP